VVREAVFVLTINVVLVLMDKKIFFAVLLAVFLVATGTFISLGESKSFSNGKVGVEVFRQLEKQEKVRVVVELRDEEYKSNFEDDTLSELGNSIALSVTSEELRDLEDNFGDLFDSPYPPIEILKETFSIEHLEVKDESVMHQSHPGARESGGGHFALTIVSEDFDGVALKKRHQMIYDALSSEMNQGIHALSIKVMTPKEIESKLN